MSIWRFQTAVVLIGGVLILGLWSKLIPVLVAAGIALSGWGLLLAFNRAGIADRYSAFFSQGFGPRQGPWQMRFMGLFATGFGILVAVLAISGHIGSS
jgi:hypothetical protein